MIKDYIQKSSGNKVKAYQWMHVSKFIEGGDRDVDYYLDPDVEGRSECFMCKEVMHVHGWMDFGDHGIIVCPGDWVIYPLHLPKFVHTNSVFKKLYRRA